MHGTAQISTELANYKEELESWKLNKIIEENNFIEDTLFAGKNSLSYNGTQKEGNIKTIIPDMKDEYIEELEIIKGELVLNTTNKTKIKSAKIAKITANPYKIIDGELLSAGENLDLISSDGILTIPENVTKIGNGAFSGVDGLKTVIIPGTVKEIGDNAFAYNTSLEKVIIQDGVEKIGNSAFSSCTNLISVEMSNSIETIGNAAFATNSKLEKIKLSNRIKKISNSLFSGCTKLSKIDIPENVTTIEDLAFHYCTELDNLYIPKNVIDISSGAFRGSSKLNTITIDKNNTSFVLEDDIIYKINGKYKSLAIVLAKNTQKKEITISEGVTTLSVGSLGYFTNIEILNLPSTLSNISGWSFAGVGGNLKTITIPESNQYYKVVDNMILSKDGLILYATSLNREEIIIPDSVKTVTASSINGSRIKKVVFEGNVETIYDSAIRGTNNLEQIIIGKNVKNISSSFRRQSYIKRATLIIDSENENYVADGNFLLTKDRKTLVTVVNDTTNITVPNGIEKIGNLEGIGLKSIILPDTIKKIGSLADNGNLTEITIPSSCTSINEKAFVSCKNLETIKIEKKENSIPGAPWGATKGLKVVKWVGK